MAHEDDLLNQKITNTVARNFKAFKIFSSPETEIEAVKTAYDALRDITFDRKIPTIKEVVNGIEKINHLLKDFIF